ncbi:MAG: 50S ribosomal protein L5 [Gammaproteobacteria bacterium]|nr:50S ribosomal protein L5 [Gammaproteobacteria bacterium]
MSILLEKYRNECLPALVKDFGVKSPMEVPRIEKIVLNMGVGEAANDKSLLDGALKDLETLSGQKPAITVAKKSIAGFKIRQGWPLGAKVTLRNKSMWNFLDKLVFICFPRVRDFRGLNPKSFNGNGDFSMGITEQIIFPEIDYDRLDKIRGLNICITTSGADDARSLAMLTSLGFPFRK